MSKVIVNLDHLCLSEISEKGIYFFLPLQADLLNPLAEWITITSLNWQATIFSIPEMSFIITEMTSTAHLQYLCCEGTD